MTQAIFQENLFTGFYFIIGEPYVFFIFASLIIVGIVASFLIRWL